MRTILITGGAGFIGSCFTRYMIETYPKDRYVVLDKLTYAGNLANLKDVDGRFDFVRGDIADANLLDQLFAQYSFDYVVNFAAETHVDRSIGSPQDFIQTDVIGTYALLEACRTYPVKMFIQISTDEVYGEVLSGQSVETDPLMPRNPYSASKAGADRLAYSYWATYGVPVVITRCSNNYGPYQYPEKMIPLFVTNLLEGQNVPLYGDGQNVRDWIYVEDHARAVAFLMEHGALGEVYNIGGECERQNIEIVQLILSEMGLSADKISYVQDRLGHDRRYALNCNKLKQLGWRHAYSFEQAMPETIRWYGQRRDWWEPIKSGAYRDYYQKMYASRELKSS